MAKDNEWRESGCSLFATIVGALLQLIFVAMPKDLFRWICRRRKDVRGQTVVITGGASGIGLRMAEIFAQRLGAKVAIIDINLDAAKTAAKKICDGGGVANAWKCDVANAAETRQCAAEIKKHFGRIDIVICNAALLYLAPTNDLRDDQIQKALNVNVLGTINTIRAFLPGLEAQGYGHIVTMASIAAHFGEMYSMAYSPTKFAVRGVMECLRVELREREMDGIACTTICPYFVRSPMVTSLGIRPVTRWMPFMTVERCAEASVDAILKESVVAFVPWWLGMLTALNAFFGTNMNYLTRDFLNCRYEMTDGDEDHQKSPIMMNGSATIGEARIRVEPEPETDLSKVTEANGEVPKLAKPKCQLPKRQMNNFYVGTPYAWILLISTGILILFLFGFTPSLFSVHWLGTFGQQMSHFASDHHALLLCANVAVWAFHALLALWSLYLSDALRLTHKCALFWFGQTLLFGIPPIIILRKRKILQNQRKKEDNTLALK